MNNFIFENATKIYFGNGAAKEYLLQAAAPYGDAVLLAYGGGSVKKTARTAKLRKYCGARAKRS